MAADRLPAPFGSRCLCAERGLLGVHEEPCAGFGSRSDELCERAERESVAWAAPVSAAVSPAEPPESEFQPSGLTSGGEISGEPVVSPADPPGTLGRDLQFALVPLGRERATEILDMWGALVTATEDLLDVGERSRAGDPSLNPEEWYAIRDYARKVLKDAAR